MSSRKLAILPACRVSLTVLALLALFLFEVPQAADLLVALGQDASPWPWLGFAIGTVWLAGSVAFWSSLSLKEAGLGSAQATPRRLAALVPLLLAAALFQAAAMIPEEVVSEMGRVRAGPQRLRLAAALLLGAGVILVAPRRPRVGARAGGMRGFVVLSGAVALAGLAAFTADPVAAAALVPAATIMLFAAAGLVCGGTLLTVLGRRTGLPLLSLAIGFTAALAVLRDRDLLADNHDVPLAGTLAARPDPASALSGHLERWEPDGAAPTPLVLVAASGGGLAAAFWTATVLGDLADAEPRFARALFAASGVSGGSLGLLAYARGPACAEGRRRCLQRALGADFLGPTLGTMLYPDLLQRFVPAAVLPDRGAALEMAWRARWRGVFGDDALARPFLEARDRPALLLNATSLATGGRMVASTLELAPGGIAQPDGDLLRRLGADLPAATAAGLSARFPYVGPLGVLRAPNGVAVDAVGDGGYFENFGATTLHELLDALAEAAAVSGRAVRFVVVQIISDPDNRPEHAAADGMARVGSWLPGELVGPAALLYRTRGARGLQATAALARRTLALGGTYIPVRLGLTPSGVAAPLGWALSAVAAAGIDAQWTAACREALLAEAGFGTVPAPRRTDVRAMLEAPGCAAAAR